MGQIPQPALATLSHDRFWREGWVYERKLDGQRCLAVRRDGQARLYSRQGKDSSAAFPEIADALSGPGQDFIIDGEIVAFEGAHTSFARLQPRINLTSPDQARRTGIEVYYYVFDVLQIGSQDQRDHDLLERKRRLRQLLPWQDPIRQTQHRRNADEAYFQQICRRGWEGLIAKRTDARYPSGRSKQWLKFKCEAGQELVIVGWSDPEGSRVRIGALLLGYYDDAGELVYAGKVGTGFTEEVLRELHSMLSAQEISRSACTRGTLPRRGVHWVRPEKVAEVAFTEWTAANMLRHPRYLGLRNDKDARDVVREAR
ncbi:MAG TPA: non-homologous end-joining DNA ligase [Ruania sp.]|nr:non-homologous end-joining DNA ligase [Ruania sp.]